MPRVAKTGPAAVESEIVRLVRGRGAVSRVEIARELDLVPSTAGIYVDRLIDGGYLAEGAAAARGAGRPPKLVELNPAGGRFVGIDFDARQVLAVAVDFAQRPLRQASRTIPARATADRVLAVIEDAVAGVIGPDIGTVLGIGLGVPGVVDPDRGVALAYRFLPDWRDVPVGPRIGERFGVPVFVENNLRSMAVGELWAGQGRGLRDIVCLGIRSGIGAGVVVGGELLRGSTNAAGEIGRWVYPDGPPRTIEEVASLTALTAGGETVADLLAGDGPAVRAAARVHGWVAHQLAALLDPERVVVAGPLVESDSYRESLRAAVTELGGPGLADRVVRSTLGPFAGALGAAALAFHYWKPTR